MCLTENLFARSSALTRISPALLVRQVNVRKSAVGIPGQASALESLPIPSGQSAKANGPVARFNSLNELNRSCPLLVSIYRQVELDRRSTVSISYDAQPAAVVLYDRVHGRKAHSDAFSFSCEKGVEEPRHYFGIYSVPESRIATCTRSGLHCLALIATSRMWSLFSPMASKAFCMRFIRA